MMFILFFLLMFIRVSLAEASFIDSNCPILYEVSSVKNDVSDILNSKRKMESFFSERKINWESGILYLFVERNGTLRLFVAEENGKITLFQYPAVAAHKWLDPFGYMKESRQQEKRVLDGNCVSEYDVDSGFLKEILSMQLDEYPYIRVIGKFRHNGSYKYIPAYDEDVVVYYGYIKDLDEIKYFRFADLKFDYSERRPPLDKFVALFGKLESFPFSEFAGDCK